MKSGIGGAKDLIKNCDEYGSSRTDEGDGLQVMMMEKHERQQPSPNDSNHRQSM